MSNKRQIQNWVAIALILVAAALLTAVWPAITGLLSGDGGGVSFEVGVQTVVINLPFPIAGNTVLELSSLAVVGILTVVVVVFVAGGGAALAGLYTLLFRTTEDVKESEAFQESRAALEAKEKERVSQLQEGRETRQPDEERQVAWSTISTTLIILFFTTLVGTLLARGFGVTGTQSFLGLSIGYTALIVVGLNVLAILIAAWMFRPQRISQVSESDYEPIPWDSLWVILTGLIVVGIGAGIVIYLNTPQ